MTQHPNDRSRILTLVNRRAPFSIVERGVKYAEEGRVSECSRTGSRISGVVIDEESTAHSATLQVVSAQEIEAECSCCSTDDMFEQWCQHAVALLMRAHELGFFDTHGGFLANEAIYRTQRRSPEEIAAIMREVGSAAPTPSAGPAFRPQVDLELDLAGDRLGVKVLFDGEPQGPAIFEGFARQSARSLDTVLLRHLDDHGSWDENRHIWYIGASDQIETALGLIQEYERVKSVESGKRLRFAPELLEARLSIEWQDKGAQLELSWLMPDDSLVSKRSDLLGTGPYWTCIENTVYRLSPAAAKLSSIFPHVPLINISRNQAGPILEALNEGLVSKTYISIRNPELQPATKVKTPTPVVTLERRELAFEHFASNEQLEIGAQLHFDYPAPPANRNVVYLPDKEKEREAIELLKAAGFEYDSEKKRYLVRGDAALELASRGARVFPPEWSVRGVEGIQKGVRFAKLSLNIDLAARHESREDAPADNLIDCRISLSQNNANIPLSTLFKSARGSSDRWLRLENGAYALVPGGGLHQLKTTLGMLDPNFRLSNSIRTRISMAQALSFGRSDDDQLRVDLDRKLEDLARKLRDFTAIPKAKNSKNFCGDLRHYQLDGLSWLGFLHEFELGGILADEMGLGKTVQALALLQLLKDRKKLKRPALIVAPTSVITNWLYEARRFTPKLSVLLLHGPDRKREFGAIDEHDIVITSYALLRIDRHELERHHFSYVILDEAQNIKNYQAAVTKSAKAIKADRRLALTGTPTENRPLELWSIMDFLMPGYLGSQDYFRNYIEKPIIEGGPEVQVLKFLNAKTRPFILRRCKAEVERELPPKSESELHVEMSDSQRLLYAQVLEEVRPRVFEAVEKKGIRGASVSILAALLRLRQICNHPNSIEALKDLPGFESGKFNLLKDLVSEALESGRKILLFSQFREMLAIIRRWLEETNVNHLYLDGATRDRQQIIDKFNLDAEVRLFLISLKAGGTGLNLTAADTVIIYDPWWNPAVEYQAVDRAHRIGQTKPVSVYRLVTEHSIEQKIMALKSRKARLVDALINDNGLSTLSLSRADLESLFSPI